MKTSELTFNQRDDGLVGTTSAVFFGNGYGTSVITGPMFYTSQEGPYECAVLKGVEGDSDICCDTPLTDDVIGYLSESNLDELLQKIENLPDAA